MVSGLVALLGAAPVFAQPAAPGKEKPAAAAPAKAGDAKPAAGAAKPGDAKPAAAAATPAKPGDTKAAAGDKAAAKPLTAKQKKDGATKAFKGAEEKFKAGDYAGALELYREADALLPGDRPRFQIAASLDKLNKAPEAVAAYQAFLDAKPDEKKLKDQIAEANARIEALKKTPAKAKLAITPEAPAGLKVTVNGVEQPLAAGNELSLPPGKHQVTVVAEGFEPATQDLELTFGETREVPLTLQKKAEPPPPPPPVAVAPPPPPPTTPAAPPPPPPAPRSKIPAYVTLGLAGAGAVVGTIFGIQALSAKSDFDAAPTTDAADRADRNALIADMSYAVAITFGVTGAVLLFSKDPAAEETKASVTKPKTAPRKAFVTPYAGPTGGGAAAILTF